MRPQAEHHCLGIARSVSERQCQVAHAVDGQCEPFTASFTYSAPQYVHGAGELGDEGLHWFVARPLCGQGQDGVGTGSAVTFFTFSRHACSSGSV